MYENYLACLNSDEGGCLFENVVQVGTSVRGREEEKDGEMSWNLLFIDKRSSCCTGHLSGANAHLKYEAVLLKQHMQAQQRLPM